MMPRCLPRFKFKTNTPLTRHLSRTLTRKHITPTATPIPPSRGPYPSPCLPSTALCPPPPSPTSSPSSPASLPITLLCPPPSCACALTPADLDIDREGTLSGTVPAYTQHVLISTGREDWASRIAADDDAHAALTRALKRELGVGGRYHDPYRPVLITHSSFPPSPSPSAPSAQSGLKHSSAFLFPSFKYVPDIGPDPEAFIRTFLRPGASRTHGEPKPDKRSTLSPSTREKSQRSMMGAALTDNHSHSHAFSRPVHDLVVLICGHASRDRRCGVMGPLLRAQFVDVLNAHGFSVNPDPTAQAQSPPPSSPPSLPSTPSPASPTPRVKTARVGLTSHIGGHRFAGNVIIYVPPGLEFSESRGTEEEEAMGDQPSAGRSSSMLRLQGMGIWYGRVEPRHVEGIVAETVRGGRVVGELFRGAVFGGGEGI